MLLLQNHLKLITSPDKYFSVFVEKRMSFGEVIIAYPNSGQWPPSAKFAPFLTQTSSYATVANP